MPGRRRSLGLLSATAYLATLLLPFDQSALARTLVRAHGRCKLQDDGFVAFNGHCVVKQKENGGLTTFEVTLDDGSRFRFAGPNRQALRVETYDGLRNVNFRENDDKGVFSWDAEGERHRLAVKVDSTHNPDARHDDNVEVTPGAAIGGAVGAMIGAMLGGSQGGSSSTPFRDGAPVPAIQSEVNDDAGDAVQTLTARGYTYRKTRTVGSSVLTYWTEPGSRHCLVVNNVKDRVQSITYTASSNC